MDVCPVQVHIVGQNALAVGYSRLSDNGKVGVKFTVNSNSQGHAGASASVGYQW